MNFKNVTRILLAALAVPAFAANGSMKGDGSAEKPFEIEDYGDLKAIGSGSYLYSSNYVVMNDIDASASKNERCDGDDDCRAMMTVEVLFRLGKIKMRWTALFSGEQSMEKITPSKT